MIKFWSRTVPSRRSAFYRVLLLKRAASKLDFFPPRLHSVKAVMSHSSLSPLPPFISVSYSFSPCFCYTFLFFLLSAPIPLSLPPDPLYPFPFLSNPSPLYLLISFHALSLYFLFHSGALFFIFVLICYVFNVLPKPSCQPSLSML